MRVSRSRLVAVGTALLVVVGGVLAAGSFASGHHPAVTHKTSALAQRTFVSAATGNDANPCTRTAPCRNFAAAIAQTSAGGEVVVLDSGGYGTVTITQAVSLIAPAGVYAGISVFSGTGITINAGPTDVVTIRGLTLNGLGGTDGIDFNSGGALYVEDSVIRNFSTPPADHGILANLASTAKVVVEDSLFTGDDFGIRMATSSGTLQATIEHCRFVNGVDWQVVADANANVVVRDTVATGNGVGIVTNAASAEVDVENSLLTQNTYGLAAQPGGMRVSETTIEQNNVGMVEAGGTIASFGNNRLAGNTLTNGSFTSTIPLQ